MLGLRFCARAFSSCGKRGPLTIAASLVAEHRLQTRRLSNCGSRAQWLRGMWDLPRPGLEPVSPALAGRFSTTAPPGKPEKALFLTIIYTYVYIEAYNYMYISYKLYCYILYNIFVYKAVLYCIIRANICTYEYVCIPPIQISYINQFLFHAIGA